MSETEICMVTPFYPPAYSGSGRQCAVLSAGLARRGVEVRVLTSHGRSSGLPDAERPAPGLAVVRLGYETDRNRGAYIWGLRVAHELWRCRKACDVIHFHGINLWALPALLVGRSLSKGTVVKVTTLGQDDPVGLSRERVGRLKSRLFQLPDAIVGNSPGIHQAFAGHRAADRVRVIWNGIDTQRFAPAGRDGRRSARIRLGLPLDRKIAVCAAAVVPRKDIDFLLDAWQSLELAPPPLLVVIGPTDQAPRYFRRICHRLDEQGLDGQVSFAGCVSDVSAYLQASDVFVFASMSEGLPSAVIEAMACGLPCVVRRIPGVTDVLIDEGRDGFVLEPTDVAGFAEAVQVLLTFPNLGAEMGTRARETVLNRFSAEVMVEHYLKLYRSVLAAHRL